MDQKLEEEVDIVIVGGGICGLATALALHRLLASKLAMDQKLEEEEDIVIVGGGICGLATALALHRKGIKTIVLERSESLRATGTAIGIHTNGWRALDQLGVGSNLRPKANVITRLRDVSLSNGSQKETQIETGEEFRCVKRIDLIEVLANSLPPDTVRFGYHIVAVKLDPLTSHPLIQLQDGRFIKSKVVIGCDGVNSVTSELLGLKPARFFSIRGVRGFTNYPSGHGFSNTFIRMRKDCLLLGRLPVNDNLVHWFVGHESCTPSDSRVSKDPELIRQASIESIKDFPTEMIEMIKKTDLDSLTCTQLRYRTPWELLLGSFRKGTVTVAGDAMHVMGPFLGQGGSAALEDAIVLGRNLASEVCTGESDVTGKQKMQQERVGAAIDNYLKERRLRLLKLSTQAYLIGMLSQATSPLTKLMYVIALVLFFRNSLSHTRYDCGRL